MDVVAVTAGVAAEETYRRVVVAADAQHGVITSQQLRALGVDAGAASRWCGAGLLARVRRGVYLVGRRRHTWHSRTVAAILGVGSSSVLSNRSALELWGALAFTDVPHVSARGSLRQKPGIRTHRATSLAPNDLCAIDFIPFTAPARSLLDFASCGQQGELETALDELRAARLLGPSDLDDLRGRTRGHHGWGPLNLLLAVEAEPGFSRSEAERRMRRLIRDAALPRPQRNVRVGSWEVDFLWPDGRLIVEIDGYAFHSGRRSFERDRAKQTELQDLGYEVLRFTWRQLTRRPLWVAARLASRLAARTTR